MKKFEYAIVYPVMEMLSNGRMYYLKQPNYKAIFVGVSILDVLNTIGFYGWEAIGDIRDTAGFYVKRETYPMPKSDHCDKRLPHESICSC